MPRCSTEMGKLGCGLDESQRRKPGAGARPLRTSSPSATALAASTYSSMIFSMAGIQLMDRWQFCRKTHVPSARAVRIMRVATGAWPWPSEQYSSWRRPASSSRPMARRRERSESSSASSCLVGSTPGLRTKMTGVTSSDTSSSSRTVLGGGTTNCGPRLEETKDLTTRRTRSGRMARTRHMCCSSVRRPSKPPGTSSSSGASDLYQISHSPGPASSELESPERPGSVSSVVTLSQPAWSSQSVGLRFCSARLRTWPPLRKKSHRGLESAFSACSLRAVICSESSSLWRSKRARQAYR
mmetsp:Transcript_19251/g.73696  ORF Transcript_19251/g.73696 Transcript_19251/m.73696 type:complete len:298 (-) Transcript_19251:2197-3090(-)